MFIYTERDRKRNTTFLKTWLWLVITFLKAPLWLAISLWIMYTFNPLFGWWLDFCGAPLLLDALNTSLFCLRVNPGPIMWKCMHIFRTANIWMGRFFMLNERARNLYFCTKCLRGWFLPLNETITRKKHDPRDLALLKKWELPGN